MKKIWTCKIGETEFDQHGMDAPMRRAVRDAYLAITGKEPDFIFSGWAGKLDVAKMDIENDILGEVTRRVAKAREDALEDVLDAVRETPFRCHAKDDVDFHSGCVQTKKAIMDRLRALRLTAPGRDSKTKA